MYLVVSYSSLKTTTLSIYGLNNVKKFSRLIKNVVLGYQFRI